MSSSMRDCEIPQLQGFLSTFIFWENFLFCQKYFPIYWQRAEGVSEAVLRIRLGGSGSGWKETPAWSRGWFSDLSRKIFRFVQENFQICPGKFSDLSGKMVRVELKRNTCLKQRMVTMEQVIMIPMAAMNTECSTLSLLEQEGNSQLLIWNQNMNICHRVKNLLLDKLDNLCRHTCKGTMGKLWFLLNKWLLQRMYF